MPHKSIEAGREWQKLYSKKPHVIERRKRESEARKQYHQTKEGSEHLYDMSLRRHYGISISDWNDMFAAQNGCCAICGRHQSDFKNRFHVDHCHETGKIRGLLCSNCNTAIGKLGSDTDLIRRAMNYLSESERIQVSDNSCLSERTPAAATLHVAGELKGNGAAA